LGEEWCELGYRIGSTMQKHYLTTALLLLTAYLTGCVPSITKTRGTISILHGSNRELIPNVQDEEAERYIVVSLWDYPTVNEKEGDIVINKVLLTEEETATIDFPTKAYWVAWTPVFGSQHLAPEPGIVVFHKDHLPSWNVGGTDHDRGLYCDKPKSHHNFSIELIDSEGAWLEKKNDNSDKWFLEEFLAEKKNLLKKMKKCKGLTEQEREMVLDKLLRAARVLGAEE
jgi:hypothetical protein